MKISKIILKKTNASTRISKIAGKGNESRLSKTKLINEKTHGTNQNMQAQKSFLIWL
jgi:hypothetical protein